LIEDEAALRQLHHPPMSRATDKVLRRLDKHCRRIIEASPFCILVTAGPDGLDVSPKGDPAGFVRVLDDETLLLPDRVGNNRFDGYANILSRPAVGLLFFVPGMNETLRVNGSAKITDDIRLLGPCAVSNRVPKVGLLITVEEAFVHCAKALVRSKLWDVDAKIDRATFPSYAEILLDHCEGLDEAENDRQSRIMHKRGLY
jgi:PPOX class probable FMN-dependent enzyme